MSMRTLEAAILQEAREVVGKRTLRMKDISEWSTSKSAVMQGLLPDEVFITLPKHQVHCAILKSAMPKKFKGAA
jgi:hypothetical protein